MPSTVTGSEIAPAGWLINRCPSTSAGWFLVATSPLLPRDNLDTLEPPDRPQVMPLESGQVLIVATDGGCLMADGIPHAGWGFACHGPRLWSSCGAVCGPCQAAQRGEAPSLVRLAVCFLSPIVNLLSAALLGLLGGAWVRGKNADLWSIARIGVQKVTRVAWVKARLTEAEALVRGFSRAHKELNASVCFLLKMRRLGNEGPPTHGA